MRPQLYFSPDTFLFPHGPSAICRTGCDSVRTDRDAHPVSRSPLDLTPPPRLNAFFPHLSISYIMSGALSHNRLPLPTSTSAFDLPTSSSPSSVNPDDGLSPFMLHQRRRPSLLNPKLGHLSLEKRHTQSPLELVQAQVFPPQEEHEQRRRLGERPGF
jgi:hypothetical protein